MTLCETLAWIAFRRDDMLTKNPVELRTNMKQQRHLLILKNPARALLKNLRRGEIELNVSRVPSGETTIFPIAYWRRMTESDIWRMAEDEWATLQGVKKVDFVPNIRVRIVTDDDRSIEGPWIGPMLADWMNTLPQGLFSRLQDGWLSEEDTADFWQYLGRTDKVPHRINFALSREDLDRVLPIGTK